jgi:hypothetical protein
MMSKNCKTDGGRHLRKDNPNPDPGNPTNDSAQLAAQHPRSPQLPD